MERNYMEMQNFNNVIGTVTASELLAQKGRLMAELVERGISQYLSLNNLSSAQTIVENFDSLSDLDLLRISGAVTECSKTGDNTMLTLQDQSGEIQVCINRSYVGEKVYRLLDHIDTGDVVRVDGAKFLTEDGEMVIRADKMNLLSRANKLFV